MPLPLNWHIANIAFPFTRGYANSPANTPRLYTALKSYSSAWTGGLCAAAFASHRAARNLDALPIPRAARARATHSRSATYSRSLTGIRIRLPRSLNTMYLCIAFPFNYAGQPAPSLLIVYPTCRFRSNGLAYMRRWVKTFFFRQRLGACLFIVALWYNHREYRLAGGWILWLLGERLRATLSRLRPLCGARSWTPLSSLSGLGRRLSLSAYPCQHSSIGFTRIALTALTPNARQPVFSGKGIALRGRMSLHTRRLNWSGGRRWATARLKAILGVWTRHWTLAGIWQKSPRRVMLRLWLWAYPMMGLSC